MPPWRVRLGPSQLSQLSQDNQCTWHGRYLMIIEASDVVSVVVVSFRFLGLT